MIFPNPITAPSWGFPRDTAPKTQGWEEKIKIKNIQAVEVRSSPELAASPISLIREAGSRAGFLGYRQDGDLGRAEPSLKGEGEFNVTGWPRGQRPTQSTGS